MSRLGRAPVPAGDVLIVSGSMGSGHDGVAAELARRLAARGIAAPVIDILDCLPAPAGALIRTGYYATATYAPRVLDLCFRTTQPHEQPGPAATPLVTRLLSWAARDRLRRLAGTARVTVSVHPFATQALGDLRGRGLLAGPTVSYLTDPAPHAMWVHPAVDHHLAVTEQTARAVAAYRVAARCGGPLAATRFRDGPAPGDRALVRQELGAPDGCVLALVVAGARGLGQAAAAARAARLAGMLPVVACGRNERLRRRLARLGIRALGWRDDLHRLMAAADILVHNAGGLTLTEAMVAGLPAVTFRPVAGHGVANAQFLEEHGMAPWARTAAALRDHGQRLAAGPRTAIPPASETAAEFIAALCG